MIPDLTSIEIAPTIIYALKRAGSFLEGCSVFIKYLKCLYMCTIIIILCVQLTRNCAFLWLHLVNGQYTKSCIIFLLF